LRVPGSRRRWSWPSPRCTRCCISVDDYLAALPEAHAAALESAFGLYCRAQPLRGLAVAAASHGVLTAAAEDRALLILVDDLHWLDPASAEAMVFALRRLDRDAVAGVMTLRAGMPAPVACPTGIWADWSPP
jgi:hypothetical protein